MKSIKKEVYQTAIDLTLDWSEFVKKSHVKILQNHFTELDYNTLMRLDHECNKAKLYALSTCEKGIAKDYSESHIKSLILSELPKLDEELVNRLFEQGMFFARKNN